MRAYSAGRPLDSACFVECTEYSRFDIIHHAITEDAASDETEHIFSHEERLPCFDHVIVHLFLIRLFLRPPPLLKDVADAYNAYKRTARHPTTSHCYTINSDHPPTFERRRGHRATSRDAFLDPGYCLHEERTREQLFLFLL